MTSNSASNSAQLGAPDALLWDVLDFEFDQDIQDMCTDRWFPGHASTRSHLHNPKHSNLAELQGDYELLHFRGMSEARSTIEQASKDCSVPLSAQRLIVDEKCLSFLSMLKKSGMFVEPSARLTRALRMMLLPLILRGKSLTVEDSRKFLTLFRAVVGLTKSAIALTVKEWDDLIVSSLANRGM